MIIGQEDITLGFVALSLEAAGVGGGDTEECWIAHTTSFNLVLKQLTTRNKMKSFQLILIAFVVACASAFAPAVHNKAALAKPLAMSNIPEPMKESRENKNAAAIAAFSTALAPFAAHATDVDEGTIIGYGAGLVACVVSLAVGFAIGYGTLVKL